MRRVLLALLVVLTLNGAVYGANKNALQKIMPGDNLTVMRDKISNNGWSFTVGNTWVYDLDKDKKSKMFNRRASVSFMKVKLPYGVGALQQFINKTVTPPSFDWRSYNGNSYIGAVRNQGSCGACYSFGAAASAEGTYNFATGRYGASCIDFSESYIAFCLRFSSCRPVRG